MAERIEPGGLPRVSPFSAGLRCRCPRCGQGRLYEGVLSVRPHCAVCGLDLQAQDSGDGPAIFVILILGFIAVGLALLFEAKVEPPLWAHAVIWPPFVLGAALLMLRPFKATLIALQFQHRNEDFHAGG